MESLNIYVPFGLNAVIGFLYGRIFFGRALNADQNMVGERSVLKLASILLFIRLLFGSAEINSYFRDFYFQELQVVILVLFFLAGGLFFINILLDQSNALCRVVDKRAFTAMKVFFCVITSAVFAYFSGNL